MPIASWMENKPLLIGIAVLVFSLIVGGYFWFFRKSSSAESAEPQVEEFVGRQQADFEAAQHVAAQQQEQEQQPQQEQQPHEE